ncbi:MAG: glycosyltransferase family 2 protein [Chthoniobacterales bacterium]|nr:glycosyltransferase family 2 protein [Chthoniobacterales bacterium]
MRIAANLNVLDEAELIELCLRHLRAIGVDLIVLTDIGSVDGTAERLEQFAGDPDICLIRLGRDDDPWGFPARMYERTIAQFSVDRVLFLDADEFWLPRSGSLRDTTSVALHDALSVRRLNVPLVELRPLLPPDLSPASYQDLYVIAKPTTDAERKFQSDPALAWIMTQVGPKTIINPRTVQGVGMGTHQVVEKGQPNPNVVWADDLIIAHLPFSTSARFLRKLENIDRSMNFFGHRLMGSQAWHWKRWLRLAKEGTAGEEFARQVMTEETFRAEQAKGTIQSVEAVFRQMAAPADAAPLPT